MHIIYWKSIGFSLIFFIDAFINRLDSKMSYTSLKWHYSFGCSLHHLGFWYSSDSTHSCNFPDVIKTHLKQLNLYRFSTPIRLVWVIVEWSWTRNWWVGHNSEHKLVWSLSVITSANTGCFIKMYPLGYREWPERLRSDVNGQTSIRKPIKCRIARVKMKVINIPLIHLHGDEKRYD